jgi:adenosylcobinamide kinase / adenosylcobinamide-phosphate guanylyltransferase
MGRKLTLVLGGARSGKSRYAQELVETSGAPALFVATATAGDDEMLTRIAAHQASRPRHWRTLEAPLQVGKSIGMAEGVDWVILDCMTLLCSNVLMEFPEPVDDALYFTQIEQEVKEILGAYEKSSAEWVIVSNEVGMGLVPPYPLGRIYRDGLGKANQMLARAADTVLLMVAGIPMRVKG